jgi:hypothetical protein
MDGFGLSAKLATECSPDEHTLADARKNGRCVFVGSFKKNDHLGINFSKQYTYCCFPTKLGRIFHEQARRQIGISWGDAKNPNCRGLTLQELQRVDMTKINFSEIFSEIAQDITKSTAHIKEWTKGAQKAFSKSDAPQLQKTQQENLLRKTKEQSGKQSQTHNQGVSDNELSY